MYVCFSFSYCELSCAIPKAGGGFDYANRALGKDIGFITGLAQVIEFVFAPPAIAIAIGAYLNLSFPQIPILQTAIIVYLLFTTLNVLGVKIAATFELFITILAVAELLLFFGVTIPHFSADNFTKNASINGWGGIFAAIPFAIWLLTSFFNQIPIEIEEAARVDGASNTRMFVQVILPLAAPGLVATGIFISLLSWNEFLIPVIMAGENAKTLPVFVASFISNKNLDWGPMAAAATVAMVPIVALTVFIQRWLVTGLSSGAVKD